MTGDGPIPEVDRRAARNDTVWVPLKGGVIPVPAISPDIFQARRYIYEARAADGTLHLVGSTTRFNVGECIAWSGYSDGPSMTQWSTRRVEVVRSEACPAER